MGKEFITRLRETKSKADELKQQIQDLKPSRHGSGTDWQEAVRRLIAQNECAAAALLQAQLLLDSVIGTVVEGGYRVVWQRPPTEIYFQVEGRLRAEGLQTRLECGHGHGWETADNKCNGRTHGSCWQEMIITWE